MLGLGPVLARRAVLEQSGPVAHWELLAPLSLPQALCLALCLQEVSALALSLACFLVLWLCREACHPASSPGLAWRPQLPRLQRLRTSRRC